MSTLPKPKLEKLLESGKKDPLKKMSIPSQMPHPFHPHAHCPTGPLSPVTLDNGTALKYRFSKCLLLIR
jgi:hypothetical protein